MMDGRQKLGAYQQAGVLTASKETVLLMLYAGAIQFAKRGARAIEEARIADRAECLSRAQQIVLELQATLNFELGGELATRLEQLYVYVTERLIQGNITNRVEPIDEAIAVLTTLHDAWDQAIKSLKSKE